MRRVADGLYHLSIALWVGGMAAIGYLAAPVLFKLIEDRNLAGLIAGEMFSLVAWVGVACGAYLFTFVCVRKGMHALRSRIFWLVLAMLTLVMASKFGVQPVLTQLKQDALPRQVMESALRDRFVVWHGISSGMFLLHSVLGALLVVWQDRGKTIP